MLKLQCHCQAIANTDRENKVPIPHNYQVGDKVLIIQKKYESGKKAKLSSPTEGPFTIIQVYTNGNVCINCGTCEEVVSICCICPYYDQA